MKALAIGEDGDLIIENNKFKMVDGEELTRQKTQEIIGTNKGEWFLDWEQGINFDNLLGKGVTDDDVRNEIEDGLRQVDENLSLSTFTREVEKRKSTINFTAVNKKNNEEISVTKDY